MEMQHMHINIEVPYNTLAALKPHITHWLPFDSWVKFTLNGSFPEVYLGQSCLVQ